MKFITLSDLRNDPRWVKKITKRNLAIEVAQVLVAARFKVGYTQSRLAKKIGTEQSGIARAESGRSLPSLSFIDRVARAYKTNILISFESMPEIRPVAVRYASQHAISVAASDITIDSRSNKAINVEQTQPPFRFSYSNMMKTSESIKLTEIFNVPNYA